MSNFQQLSKTFSSINGQQRFSADPLAVLTDSKNYTAPPSDQDLSSGQCYLRGAPTAPITVQAYRARQFAMMAHTGESSLYFLPTVGRQLGSHVSIVRTKSPTEGASILSDSVLQGAAPKGPVRNLIDDLLQPKDAQNTERVRAGAAAEPIVLLLAALAVEHALSPLTQPIVPVAADVSILDLHMVDPRQAQYCIRNPALLQELNPAGHTGNGAYGMQYTNTICVYVPHATYYRAMCLLTALGRNNGPYAQRVRSCYSIDTSNLRVIAVTRGGTGGRPLRNIDPAAIWDVIGETLHVLETYNGVKPGKFMEFVTLFLHNTPVWDTHQMVDLAQIVNHGRNIAATFPHSQEPLVANSDNVAVHQPLVAVENVAPANNILINNNVPGATRRIMQHILLGTLNPQLLMARPAGEILYRHRDDCTFAQLGHVLGDVGLASLALYRAADHTWAVDLQQFIANQQPGVVFPFPRDVFQHGDPWFWSGNARILVHGEIDPANLPAPVAAGNNPPPAVGSVAHLAACGLIEYHRANGLVRADLGNLMNLPVFPAPVAPRGRYIVTRWVQNMAALIDTFTVTFFRDIGVTDADLPRYEPLPTTVNLPRRVAAPYTQQVQGGVYEWATNILGDVQNTLNHVPANDATFRGFLDGTMFTVGHNNPQRQATAYHTLSLLMVRQGWESHVGGAFGYWRATQNQPQPYPFLEARHCVYLGGAPINLQLVYHGGLWTMGHLLKTPDNPIVKPHPAVAYLRDPQEFARLCFTYRASADLASVITRFSYCGITQSDGVNYMPDAIVDSLYGDQQNLDVRLSPMVHAAMTLRVLHLLGNWAPAGDVMQHTPGAAPYVHLHGTMTNAPQVEYQKFDMYRIPQVLHSVTSTVFLDVSFPEFRPSADANSILNRCEWNRGGSHVPDVYGSRVSATASTLMDELYYTVCRAQHADVTSLRLTDVYRCPDLDIRFRALGNVPGRWNILPIAMRIHAGCRLSVGTMFHGGVDHDVGTFTAKPAWFGSMRNDYTVATTYVVVDSTRITLASTLVKHQTLSPCAAFTHVLKACAPPEPAAITLTTTQPDNLEVTATGEAGGAAHTTSHGPPLVPTDPGQAMNLLIAGLMNNADPTAVSDALAQFGFFKRED